MLNGKEKMMLLGFIGAALLVGLGFWGYYALKNPEVSPETRDSASSTPASEREKYLENIKVVLTNEVYPTDIYQSNPRLRTYIGKVQNTGERTVIYLGVKIVYLDKSEEPIWEENRSVNATLKPNFIQEFPFGGLQVPSAWTGKVDYQITEIRFQDDEGARTITYPSRYQKAPLDRPLQQILIFPNP